MTLTQQQKNIAAIALRMKATGQFYTRKKLRVEFGTGQNLTLKVFKELESNPIYKIKIGVAKGSLKVLKVNYTETVKPYDSVVGKATYIAKGNRLWDLTLGVNAPQGA